MKSQLLLQALVDGQLMVVEALRSGMECEGDTVTKAELEKFCAFVEKKARMELRRHRYTERIKL